MSLSPKLSSNFTNTKLRTPNSVCEVSGMCSVCSDKCNGLCEIALSALRGSEATYPYGTTTNQFASEKKYPFDFSHFNINGRVFGAMGASEDSQQTNSHIIDLSCEIGYLKKIKLKAPIILPAMAKLDWEDYFSGAAMAGVMVVIGESAIKADSTLSFDANGKVSHAPILGKMIDCFRKYDRGFGDIALQVNADDVALGTAEYALKNFDLKTVEIKFGQAAKGISHVAPVNSFQEAQNLRKNGYLVFPDPLDSNVIKDYENGVVLDFMQYGRLPMWNEEILAEMIERYRSLGAENILFKMAGFDKNDIRRVLQIASNNNVALVTFDGAGGGTGHSPCKMMNEWSYPTIDLEKIVYQIVRELDLAGEWIPAIAMAGGITMEDTMFKSIALGAPYIKMVGIGRGAMAAAMSAKNMKKLIDKEGIPKTHQSFGEDSDSLFKEAKLIKSIYNDMDNDISYGAIGLYSYIQRITFGMKLFMTLNRKFALDYLDKSDLIPLTKEAKDFLSDY